MVEFALQAAAALSLVNVLLLLGLIYIYGGSLRQVKAEFTAGLLFFAALMLVQNLIALYSYVAMFMYFATGAGALVLGITAAETAGLVVLLWMSFR
jgi:hypothetical protein